jgi:protein TonB
MPNLKATIRIFLQLSMLLALIQSVAAQELESTTAAKPADSLANFDLVKTKDMAPVYPRAAMARDQEGWVDLAITISPDGTVESIAVIDANPKRLFERAAIRAASTWEFVPPKDSGIDTPVVSNARISFVLEG